ncbi:hypothetical protein [Arthrobacter caoxuetaonis]|uniref:Uncharacterized protein n=1 Tax=Arthrobacter caoxuetaonis TaxID=2886935 RepID=A0A9X1MJK1_9MICC|nr:hypothetical protein [Arthrobacter caoxuetaonis]MCC3299704.1 hypothetical protein [Arthrobacter caoxuetaonis]USQ59394.1 hypothetical protein NF551_17770 [Arthrobacter caoxuetaonis]
MSATMPRPDYAPTGALAMTLGELAERHEELRPKTRSFLRVTFPYLKFTPQGQIRSIENGKLVLIQGKIHPKTYDFSGADRLDENTPCWVWTINDERADAASKAA